MTELFGFEVTKKESSVGGKEKTDGRPIYLDAQVSTASAISYRVSFVRLVD